MKTSRSFGKLYIQISFVLFLIGCATDPQTKQSVKDERLNVLFIVSDDLRTELGAYGYKGMITPNIDRLASEGRLFKEAYVQQAICNPSRMSFLTGLRPDELRVYGNKDHFRSRLPNATTIPQHFKENGYRTQSIGKVFHGGMNDPFAWSVPPVKIGKPRYGLTVQAREDSAKAAMTEKGTLQTRYLKLDSSGLPIRQIRTPGEEYHEISWEAPDEDPFYFSDGKNCQYALKTLDSLAESQESFFLAVGFSRPHLPYVAPKQFFDLYEEDKLSDEVKKLPEGAPNYAFNGHPEIKEYSDYDGGDKLPLEKQPALRKAYRACVSYVDFLVGELINKLEETGLTENTIVVLIGDHGYHLGEQDNWGKSTNFDWGTRAPLIVRVPEQNNPGQPSEALVEFIDILPSVSELAGLDSPSPASGKSFAQVIHDPKAAHKDYAFSQYPRRRNGVSVMGYTIRTKDWRYTQWINRKNGNVEAEELYDLSDGEMEKVNLVNDAGYSATRTELLERLKQNINLNKSS